MKIKLKSADCSKQKKGISKSIKLVGSYQILADFQWPLRIGTNIKTHWVKYLEHLTWVEGRYFGAGLTRNSLSTLLMLTRFSRPYHTIRIDLMNMNFANLHVDHWTSGTLGTNNWFFRNGLSILRCYWHLVTIRFVKIRWNIFTYFSLNPPFFLLLDLVAWLFELKPFTRFQFNEFFISFRMKLPVTA